MTQMAESATPSTMLTRIDARFLMSAALGGLLGGLALFVLMAAYNAAQGMGFWSILNACFASFVYKNAGMTGESGMMNGTSSMHGSSTTGAAMPGHEAMTMTTGGPIVASHLLVGGVLHLAVSAFAGIAFVLVIALLLRSGIKPVSTALASPLGYVATTALGGALLYVIMMYGIAPALNTEISDFTPRGPFFAAHVLFGAVTGAFVYWRVARPRGAAWLHAPFGTVAG